MAIPIWIWLIFPKGPAVIDAPVPFRDDVGGTPTLLDPAQQPVASAKTLLAVGVDSHFDDDFEDFTGCSPMKAGGVGVLWEQDGNLSGLHPQWGSFRREFPQGHVFFRVVRQRQILHGGERCPQDGFPALMEVLDIDVLPVGFKQGVSLRFGLVTLHQGKTGVASEVMPTFRWGVSERLQKMKSLFKQGVKALILGGLAEGVQNHAATVACDPVAAQEVHPECRDSPRPSRCDAW